MMITRFQFAIAVAMIGVALATLDARQRPASSQQSTAARVPEVFCNTMQAGALCPTGTVSVLKLSGPKADQWLDAVQKYNDAVEGATRKLKADARNILTPAQMAELDRWMDKGLNPEVNRLLASRSR
jgi:hypothetical protein